MRKQGGNADLELLLFTCRRTDIDWVRTCTIVAFIEVARFGSARVSIYIVGMVLFPEPLSFHFLLHNYKIKCASGVDSIIRPLFLPIVYI